MQQIDKTALFKNIHNMYETLENIKKQYKCNVPSAISSICSKVLLQEKNGQLEFTKKPRINFLYKIWYYIFGKPVNADFALLTAKIDALFACVNRLQLQDAEQAQYRSVQQFIRELNFYIRKKKVEKGLEIKNIISDNDSYIQNNRALKNIGTICWLNSCIQYLTSSPIYKNCLDRITQHNQLYSLIKDLVISLRLSKVPKDKIDELHNAIIGIFASQKYAEDKQEIDELEQEDAQEFLAKMRGDILNTYSTLNILPNNEAEVLKIITVFKDPEQNQQKSAQQNLSPTQSHTIKPSSKSCTIIDLNKEMIQEEEVEINSIEHTDQKSGKKVKIFKKFDVCIQFPKFFEIVIPRGIEHQIKEGETCTAPIKLEADGTICFTEYEPIYDSSNPKNIIDAVPKYTCYCRPIASITHIGKYVNSGHYIMHERMADETIIKYNDDKISIEQDTCVWQNAYILTLELEKRVPIIKARRSLFK